MKPAALGNISIRQKLTLLMMLTSGMALTVTGVALVAYELLTYRPRAVADLKAEADRLGYYAAPPIKFANIDAAVKTLEVLERVFLMKSKKENIDPGKKVVIIGAGNVGCDVATEAGRLGATSITLIDIQEPASFGKEREEAESYGAVFRWPCFTKEITEEGVILQTGELIPANTVVISIGDLPETDFLPESVAIHNGYITVDEFFRTSDPKIFAIGDAVRPGILSDAIGAGRKASEAIMAILRGEKPHTESASVIDTDRIKMEYFDPRITGFDDLDQCGTQCSSCGNCRDCGICMVICPHAAISREDLGEEEPPTISGSETTPLPARPGTPGETPGPWRCAASSVARCSRRPGPGLRPPPTPRN